MTIDLWPRCIAKFAALALAMLATAAPVQAAESDAVATPVAQQTQARDDLLGLHFGMAAVTARRFLEGRGFRLIGFQSGPSWYALVGKQTKTSVERRYRGSISAARFEGPNGEAFALDFVQMPRGAALSRAALQMPSTLSPEQLRTALIQAYGAPNCGEGWCPAVRDGPRARLQPRIMADFAARTVTLDAGPQLAQLASQSVQEAIRDCRQSRLGVPIDSEYFRWAC